MYIAMHAASILLWAVYLKNKPKPEYPWFEIILRICCSHCTVKIGLFISSRVSYMGEKGLWLSLSKLSDWKSLSFLGSVVVSCRFMYCLNTTNRSRQFHFVCMYWRYLKAVPFLQDSMIHKAFFTSHYLRELGLYTFSFPNFKLKKSQDASRPFAEKSENGSSAKKDAGVSWYVKCYLSSLVDYLEV